MKRFETLIELQKETYGATFTLSYSVRTDMYCIRFNNKNKVFRDKSINECISKAIDYILEERRQTGVSYSYTLFKY